MQPLKSKEKNKNLTLSFFLCIPSCGRKYIYLCDRFQFTCPQAVTFLYGAFVQAGTICRYLDPQTFAWSSRFLIFVHDLQFMFTSTQTATLFNVPSRRHGPLPQGQYTRIPAAPPKPEFQLGSLQGESRVLSIKSRDSLRICKLTLKFLKQSSCTQHAWHLGLGSGIDHFLVKLQRTTQAVKMLEALSGLYL